MRLRHLSPDELDSEQRALYDVLNEPDRRSVPHLRSDVQMVDEEGRLQGPFNALLFHPLLGSAVQEVSRSLRFDGVLSKRVREIVVLIVAASQRSDFEWHAHAAIAATMGFSDEQIDALATEAVVTFDDPVENVAAALARSLVATGDADDALFERARAVLGEAGIVEVSTTVGVYQLLAQQMRLFRVDAPPGPFRAR